MTETEFQDILRDTREDILAVMRQEGFYFGKSRKLRYDATAWDLNNGACEEFADAVVEAVPEADALYPAELVPGMELLDCPHVMLFWRGKFYDAECIQGVKDWRDLPLMKNRGKSRARVLRERRAARKDCV